MNEMHGQTASEAVVKTGALKARICEESRSLHN